MASQWLLFLLPTPPSGPRNGPTSRFHLHKKAHAKARLASRPNHNQHQKIPCGSKKLASDPNGLRGFREPYSRPTSTTKNPAVPPQNRSHKDVATAFRKGLADRDAPMGGERRRLKPIHLHANINGDGWLKNPANSEVLRFRSISSRDSRNPEVIVHSANPIIGKPVVLKTRSRLKSTQALEWWELLLKEGWHEVMPQW